MAEVIPLKRPGGRFADGALRCLRCKHDWIAARNLPSDALECPNCGCFTGLPRGTFEAAEDKAVWTCNCGNSLVELIVDKAGAEELLCISCGYGKPVKS